VSGNADTVVTTLAAGRKANQLYPEQHPAFVEALDALVTAVSDATAAGPFRINVHQGRLYHESVVISEETPGLTSLEEAFESRRIESLTLHPGFTREEAVGLVHVLGLKPSTSLDIERELADRGIANATVAFLAEDEEQEERDRLREQDRALYNRLVSVLRTMSAQVAKAHHADLENASGLVGNIMRRLLEDQASVLGLATIKGQSETNLFHSINVMIYSLTLGASLGLPEEGMASLGLAGLMHDVGKVVFDPADPNQAQSMHVLHPTVGADILSRLPDDDKAPMLVAYEHHMHTDGAGFPDRPADYVTHPFSRMVAVANRYANLVDPGANREGLTPDRSIMQILDEAGTTLDPLFARLFAKAMGVFPVGCLVRLTDQTVGVVARASSDVMKPVVRLTYDAKGLELDDPHEVDLADEGLEILEVVEPESLNVEVSEKL